MEEQLIEDAIRRGREDKTGGVGRKPTVPFKSRKPEPSNVPATLLQLQEQLKRKQALLADRTVVGDLPDKGARITANIAELEARIAALQQSGADREDLSEKMRILSLASRTTAPQPSSPMTETAPADQIPLTRIPNPFKGDISTPSTRAISDDRRKLGIYGRREFNARREKQREVKALSLADCQQAESARLAKEKEWMIKDAELRLKGAAGSLPGSTERREGAAWTSIRTQKDDESDDEADLPPVEEGQDDDDE